MKEAVKEHILVTNPVPKPAELIEALEQLQIQNDDTDDVTMSIKEKLITILNWQDLREVPMLPPLPELDINCAIGRFNYELRRQRDLNQRLNDILLHLGEII